MIDSITNVFCIVFELPMLFYMLQLPMPMVVLFSFSNKRYFDDNSSSKNENKKIACWFCVLSNLSQFISCHVWIEFNLKIVFIKL